MLGFSLRINISRVEVVDSRSLDLRGGIHEYRHSVAEKKKGENFAISLIIAIIAELRFVYRCIMIRSDIILVSRTQLHLFNRNIRLNVPSY